MNDQIEILKRQFWKQIRPPEPVIEKVIVDCSIKVSKTNLTPPQNIEIDGWTLIGKVDKLKIDFYRNSNHFEFSFEKSNDLIEELFILKDYSVRIEVINRIDGRKLYYFNNNNEFYLLGNQYYFQGSYIKDYYNSKTYFLMTYFAKP